jgi:arylsulfatase A-like enzyme
VVASLTGCPGSQKQVVYDLAERVRVAERWSSREVFLFGTSANEPHQVEGFYREGGRLEGDPYVWSKGEAELSLVFPEVRARTAVLDLAPYRGVKSQSVEVRLNGDPLTRLALNDDRHRYRLSLPAEAQKTGENRLRFVFLETGSPARDTGSADRRELAAAFYSLTVGAAEDPGVEDLLGRDAPHPFAVEPSGGIPVLSQVGPSVVRYAVKLPRQAELRFTPDLDPRARAAAGAAHFRVTAETRAGEEKEIWSQVVGAGDPKPKEVAVRLPGSAGDIVRVGLQVGAPASGRFAWGRWRAPRILGRPDLASSASRRSAEEEARADGLRKSLSGVSVVYVVLDAARARQLGCYGYSRATTPEIDRIAAEGIVFERAFTPAVYTLGAMSSVWTSQYPDRHHAEISYADRLPAGRLILSEALGALGVGSAGFVLNPMAGKALGFERGFSEFVEVFSVAPESGSRGEGLRRVLPQWLAGRRGSRFFAYVHFREPHFPFNPGPPFDTQFGPDAPLTVQQRQDKTWYTDVNQKRVTPTPEQIAHLVRLYDGNLAYVDREVALLRQALEQAGLWDQTVLIISADHGEQLYEHGYISHSAQVYEESVNVPLIVRFPAGKGPRGTRVKELVDLLDLGPTVMDVFGLRGQGSWEKAFQGQSLLPVIAGAKGKPAVLSRTVWERPVYALRDARFKYIFDTRTGEGRLFDLEQDPGEMRDVQASQPLRAAYYRESVQQWVGSLSDEAEGSGPSTGTMTREQCEQLKALGYTHVDCP